MALLGVSLFVNASLVAVCLDALDVIEQALFVLSFTLCGPRGLCREGYCMSWMSYVL